jgi:hypothetical protein
MLGNQISGSELRNRVTACRKRLRENRVMLKAQTKVGVGELFPDAQASSAECSARPAAAVQTNHSFFELAPQADELEVGIT